jgi:hypothetical protein
MPSAKPDSKEVNALLVKRGLRYADPPLSIYAELHHQCEAVAGSGYVTQEGAASLWHFLSAKPQVASVYPNTVLAKLLQDICERGHWTSDTEHDLLHIIHVLYLGYGQDAEQRSQTQEPRPPPDLSFAIADCKLRSAALRGALASQYFDSKPAYLSIADKFVGFTGKFQSGTREACFGAARRLGAVPCDPASYMEFLFVGHELEEVGFVSSKLDSALFFRRMYGRLLVLRERDWESVASDG